MSDIGCCSTCKFWNRMPGPDDAMNVLRGHCRRRSPRAGENGSAVLPITGRYFSCGDYESKEDTKPEESELTLRLKSDHYVGTSTATMPRCPDCRNRMCIKIGMDDDAYFTIHRDTIRGSNQQDILRYRLPCRCLRCNRSHDYVLHIMFGAGYQEYHEG